MMTQQAEAIEVPADGTEVTDLVQMPAAATGEADDMDGACDSSRLHVPQGSAVAWVACARTRF